MEIQLEAVRPEDIERRSMELIAAELPHPIPPDREAVVKRVIHTTADFEYADTLTFTPDVCARAVEVLRGGATIVTDTRMAFSGVNKAACAKLGVDVVCFMGDADVAAAARDGGTTRAAASMDKAAGSRARWFLPSATPPLRWSGSAS